MSELITPAWGNVHPLDGTAVDPQAVVDALYGAGVLGAVAEGSGRPGASVELLVLVDEQGRVWSVGPDGAAATTPLAQVAEELVLATGLAVDLDEVSLGPEGSVLDELGFWVLPGAPVPDAPDVPAPAPPDVLISRVGPDMLGLLARDAGSPLEWAEVDGWTVVRFCERDAQLHEHAFVSDEVPVVALTSTGGDRWASVLTSRGLLPGLPLSRQAVLHPSWGSDDLAAVDPDVAATLAEVARWCANQHLEQHSEATQLLDGPGFDDTTLSELAEALAEPDPTQWSARVLAALRLPVLAADVHEGRAELPGAVRVEPMGLWASVRAAMRRERVARSGSGPQRYRR